VLACRSCGAAARGCGASIVVPACGCGASSVVLAWRGCEPAAEERPSGAGWPDRGARGTEIVVPGSNGRETASVEPASNGRTAGCNVHDDGDGEAGDDRADELAVTHVCGARAAARLRGPGAAKRVVPVDSNKAAANSSTDAKRCSGSVARACCNAGRRAGGTCIHDSAPGRPGNSPVNTLCNVTASEYTSLRASAGCPSATSGAMYAGVP